MVRNLDASLEAVEDILGALLDMSRLDAGAMKPEFTAFRLDDLFRQLSVEFTPMADAKSLKLVFVPSHLSVRSDRRLLRRVLQNLVSNAIKYTPSGKVLVGARRRKDRLRLEVRDTGLGIPQNRLKTIFKEFQRLEAGAKVARGLGLGLSIVERMVRVLGHKLDVTSQQGKGSCFALDLAISAAVPVEASERLIAPVASPLSGLVVVAIDNEPQILSGMAALLNQWGCRVVTGEDARAATAALAEQRLVPDVVLADYHLDESNGIDAIIQLRWRFGPDLPAVLITADRTPEVREAALAKDIHMLNKPLKPAALRALLTQWRGKKPGK
jgi:CheY-like chemotaxis protein/two-component sensor histidine kinase